MIANRKIWTFEKNLVQNLKEIEFVREALGTRDF